MAATLQTRPDVSGVSEIELADDMMAASAGDRGVSVHQNGEHDHAGRAHLDDAVMSEEPGASNQNSPAKGKGRGRGRWVSKAKAKISKPAPQKQQQGRGRRHKLFDSLKAQAVHERLQELKSAYNSVSRHVKAPLQELADRSISRLIGNSKSYKSGPEYEVAQKFLDKRFEDTRRLADIELDIKTATARKVYGIEQTLARREYEVSN